MPDEPTTYPVLRAVPCATADMLAVEHHPGHTVIKLISEDIQGSPQPGAQRASVSSASAVLALTLDAKDRLITLLQAWEHKPPHVLIYPTPIPRTTLEMRQEVDYG